jgi:hypothetical protein
MTSSNCAPALPSDPIGKVRAAIVDWAPLYAALEAQRPGADGWVAAKCPFHEDRTPSFSFNRQHGGFKCHTGCGEGSAFDYVMKREEVSLMEAVHRIESLFGVAHSDSAAQGEATYEYPDEGGKPLYRVVRKYDVARCRKTYHQCKPDGCGGWIWNVKGVRRVLYRLPDLIARADETVFVVEGEKCADRLHREGRLATTAPGGAEAAWLPDFSTTLKDRVVVVLPDNDKLGHAHGEKVARALNGVAASVRVVALPDLPDKGDIVDWLDAGHTPADLDALVSETPTWEADDERVEGSALPLPVLDGATFLTQDFGVASYVVDRIIPTGSCGFLVGPPKTFKSWSGLDLLFAVATGTRWLGYATGDPADVLLIDAESIPQRLQERIRLVAQARGANAEAMRRFKVLSPGRVLLSDPEQMRRFADTLVALRPTLAIIDCFARFHALDENSAKDMSPLLGNMRDAANAAGSALLVVHHCGKSNTGGKSGGHLLRGSSDLHGWYDYAAFVERKGDTATVSFECRYGEAPDPVEAMLRIDDHGAQFLLNGPAPSIAERMAALIANSPDGCTGKELADQLKISHEKARELIAKLTADGVVTVTDEKRKRTGRSAGVIRLCQSHEMCGSPSISPSFLEGTL